MQFNILIKENLPTLKVKNYCDTKNINKTVGIFTEQSHYREMAWLPFQKVGEKQAVIRPTITIQEIYRKVLEKSQNFVL